MTIPKRIQRKRTNGWKMPENTVSVTRPGKWGNPFKVGESLLDVPFLVLKRANLSEPEIEGGKVTQSIAVKLFEAWLTGTYLGKEVLASAKERLAGKDLACFCAEGQPCHADILLKLANE